MMHGSKEALQAIQLDTKISVLMIPLIIRKLHTQTGSCKVYCHLNNLVALIAKICLTAPTF